MPSPKHASPVRSWPSSLVPSSLPAEDILWDVHERHLDEAAFCFELREAALDAPHYTLEAVESGPELRLTNHLEALRRGGPLVADRLLEVVSDTEHDVDRVAVAALGVLAAHPGQARGVRALLAQLHTSASEDQREGVVRALELGVDPGVNEHIVAELRRDLETAPVQEPLLRVLASHIGNGVNHTWATSQLGPLLCGSDAKLAQAAAQLARHGADPRTLAILASVTQAVQQAQTDEQTDDLRRATLECALIHGLPGSGDWVRYWAQRSQTSSMRDHALTWIALLGGPSEHAWLVWLAKNTEPSRALLWALGCCGRVEAVDRCLEWVDDPVLAPLAAEAICAITGLSVEDDRYWLSPSETDSDADLPPLEHDDLEADLVPDRDDALPRPDPAAIRDWWARTRAQFSTDLRYHDGRPLDGLGLLAALEHGSARRRGILAFELAVRSRSRMLIDTRAWCWMQRASLAAAAIQIAGIDPQKGML